MLQNNILLNEHQIGTETVRAKILGKKGKVDIYGLVIGAQNRGDLRVEIFEKSDYAATQEYFGAVHPKFYEADFDTEMVRVDFGEISDQAAIDMVLYRVGAYMINQKIDPIRYPAGGLGYNSNSWAQSIIEYAGGKSQEDFSGTDIGHNKRIPRTYFDAMCPIKPRPKLNQ